MKTCFKCGKSKPPTEFYAHPRAKDGRDTKCKECVKTAANANRAAKIEQKREYDRLRGNLPHRVAARKSYEKTDAYRESHKRSRKRYIIEHPNRIRAQIAVGNAIRDGRLKREPCIVCGDIAEAHHPNYDAPLDVVWLCTHHHIEAHSIARRLNRRS